METKRTRNWATIIYPRQKPEDVTECPENWAEVLEQLGVKAAVSPLHDRDLKDDGSGEYKKPHRHVLLAFEGVKTRAQVKELVAKIGGISPEPINSMYAQVRYLTHKDSKDKAQYSALDVLTFGGFEYKRYASTKEDEDREATERVGRIFELMDKNGLQHFHQVAGYLMQEEPELFSVLRKNSYFFAQYIKSKKDFTCFEEQVELYLLSKGRASLHNIHYGNLPPEENEEQGGNQ